MATKLADRLSDACPALSFIYKLQFGQQQLTLSLESLRAIALTHSLPVQVQAGLRIARLLAQATPSQADDLALVVIDRIMVGPAFSIAQTLVGKLLEGNPERAATAPDGIDVAAVEAAGVPWPILAEVSRFIARLIKSLGPACPATTDC